MQMETCVRGFSNTFLPENKVEAVPLQLVEQDELTRVWKATRRQRAQQQEQLIWEKFVKEEDAVQTVCKEDPYLFVEQLPEGSLSAMVDTELDRMRQQQTGAAAPKAPGNEQPSMSSIDLDGANSEVFRIYDDKEDESGDEVNESFGSPCTVRERSSRSPSPSPSPGGHARSRTPSPRAACSVAARPDEGTASPNFTRIDLLESNMASEQDASRLALAPTGIDTSTTGKSSENVATMIESSIYCAKVRDLRLKMANEITGIIKSLDCLNMMCMDPNDLRKICKRAAEFSVRFQRIHLYQLQRVIHDIRRHNMQAMPFAKHTQFQAQMVRVVSLHQNTQQAFQVFHKSIEQTYGLREAADQLRALAQSIRDAAEVCSAIDVPHNFTAAKELYNDELLGMSVRLDLAIKEHTERSAFLLNRLDARNSAVRSKLKRHKTKDKGSSRKKVTPRTALKLEANERLSMYSLDTTRVGKKKFVERNTSPTRFDSPTKGAETPKEKNTVTVSKRKSPRARGPLMRAPVGARGRDVRRRLREQDIHTMVEGVENASGVLSPSLTGNTVCGSLPPQTDRTGRIDRTATAAAVGAPTATAAPTAVRKPSAAPTTDSLVGSVVGKKALKTGKSSASKARTPRQQKPSRPPIRSTRSPRQQQLPSSQQPPALPPLALSPHTPHSPPTYQTRSPPRSVRSPVRNTDRSPLRTASPHRVTECLSRPQTPHARPNHKVSPRLLNDGDHRGSPAEASRPAALAPTQPVDPPVSDAEMSKLLRQLCGGDVGSKQERYNSGAKNAQLFLVNGKNPSQPSTQLLRILEETIQKKIPKSVSQKPKSRDPERLWLAFNIPDRTADNLFQYRTKFVQHMLSSSLYANCSVGRPWEMIGSVSEQIIDELLSKCAKEMEIQDYLKELYRSEVTVKS